MRFNSLKTLKKPFLMTLLAVAVFAAGFLFFSIHSKLAQAGTEHNVYGWAWSENIGWISFNCYNYYGGNFEQVVNRCQISNYGVNVDSSTGLFSGYAWSENIGWISFNVADLTGCPSGPCEARYNSDTQHVSGWARALAAKEGGGNSGGWEGWISLRGANYGVFLEEMSAIQAEFMGWAWGGGTLGGTEVIGWISFNCRNQNSCGTSNYKVLVKLDFNNAPFANDLKVAQNYCNISPGVGMASFEWLYNDTDGDSQSEYNLQIATNSSFSNIVVDSTNSQVVPPGGHGTSAVSVKASPLPNKDITYNSTYYWRVRVRDSEGTWSSFANGPSFATADHAWPWINFSWAPLSPAVGERVDFNDSSTAYGGATKDYWLWEFPSGTYSCENPETGCEVVQTPSIKFNVIPEEPNDWVYLSVTDSDGFTCKDGKSINVTLPLPEWKEITPF